MTNDLKAKLKKLGKQHVIETEHATEFTGKYVFDLDELVKLVRKELRSAFADGGTAQQLEDQAWEYGPFSDRGAVCMDSAEALIVKYFGEIDTSLTPPPASKT